MHLRILPTRLEYLFGALPTTPFLDGHTAQRMAEDYLAVYRGLGVERRSELRLIMG